MALSRCEHCGSVVNLEHVACLECGKSLGSRSAAPKRAAAKPDVFSMPGPVRSRPEAALGGFLRRFLMFGFLAILAYAIRFRHEPLEADEPASPASVESPAEAPVAEPVQAAQPLREAADGDGAEPQRLVAEAPEPPVSSAPAIPAEEPPSPPPAAEAEDRTVEPIRQAAVEPAPLVERQAADVTRERSGIERMDADFVVTRPAPLYERARQDAKVVGQLKPGTVVRVVAARGDWMRVRSSRGRDDAYMQRGDLRPR